MNLLRRLEVRPTVHWSAFTHEEIIPDSAGGSVVARKWFLSANRLDPEDPRPLIDFYESFAANGETPTANSVAGLSRALELAPQDRSLQMQVARQSLVDGEIAQARQSLVLVANNAHAGAPGKKATAALEKLDQEGPAAALELLGKPD